MKFVVLFLVLLAAAGWWVLGRRRSSDAEKTVPPPPAPPRQIGKPEAIVACAHCGVHLPAAEALQDDAGRPYCSEAHRRAGPAT
jgi:uncharacterized protein